MAQRSKVYQALITQQDKKYLMQGGSTLNKATEEEQLFLYHSEYLMNNRGTQQKVCVKVTQCDFFKIDQFKNVSI